MQFNNPPGKIKIMTTPHLKKSMAGSPLRHGLFLMTLALACFALSPRAQALLPAPTPDGAYPGGNTAEGEKALFHVDFHVGPGRFEVTGENNTALGAFSLTANTTGSANTATGNDALDNNTSGDENTANGAAALFKNTTGADNTASGWLALLANTIGNNNTANGAFALNANTGSNNVALGARAGINLTTGDNNIVIGFGVAGEAGDSNTIRIGKGITRTVIDGINGATASGGAAVFVVGEGKLGTLPSSARFKDDIKPMDKASEAVLALKPVSFRYKKEVDPQRVAQFGLVAEDVEKINPDLVIRDAEGRPQTVRYEQVNAMLLNEFLKEHRQVAGLKSTVAEQRKGMEAMAAQLKEQAAQIQKVSAQIEATKPAPQVVNNP
jgi:uncharacterized coiled-coil protein SlyX